ncbi:MAG: MerR family transcriptional regulator [bacterium]|nr:MerR family transcriptional regulator [bacterium]
MDEEIRIGKAAEILGVTVQTMRNWEKMGKLKANRSAGGQRYYKLQDIQRFALDLEIVGWAWAASAQPPELSDEYYCERQDRFTTRLEKMSTTLLRALGDNSRDIVSLLTLVVGEIGDNSFAHNVGNWPDVLGIFYAYDIGKRQIVLADRGRGVRATLKNVRPDLSDDVAALKVAFTEIISGRSPEKRGNGLKSVRAVAESNSVGLYFRSGIGAVYIPKDPGLMHIKMVGENVRGVYAVITF